MVLAGIIALIVLGILLLFLEFFVVPGISIFGIAGIIVMVLGLYFSYSSYGVDTGNGILFGTFVLLGSVFYISYKNGIWKKMALNTEVSSKVNELNLNLHVGDRGISISRLAPMGTVQINDTFLEASTKGLFIRQNTEVEIISILNNKVIVKPIKQ